ncbi:MAG: glycosyltransferase [Gallionellaceae bacterium]|nr:glycosyltransferase [Gallionellaceae bacterium]
MVTLRIGDVLLATPLIRSLRLAWPEAEIDALVFEQTEGILLSNPDIHRVITVTPRPGFLIHLHLVASLFRRYDLAVTPLMGDRPVLYTWIAGKKRLGVLDGSRKHRWKEFLLSDWTKYDHVGTHTVLMGLKLADLLGIRRNHEVTVSWGPLDETRAAGALPFDIRSEVYAVLHIFPKFPYKMWRQEGWVELAQWLVENKIRPVLTGGSSAEEVACVAQIAQAMPVETVNMAGKLSLPESAFLISRAQYYVGPDTALTHMAAALGTPTVALFGPSNPVKWGPWPKNYAEDCSPYGMKGSQRAGNVLLLQGEGDCAPCMQEGCKQHTASLSDCLQGLPAAKVISALHELSVAVPDWPQGHKSTVHCTKKKIAVVVPKYGLVGGGERFASEVTGRLAQNENFEIHVFANRWISNSERIHFHKIPLIRLPRSLNPLFFAWFVKRAIRRMGFDLVHSHHWIFHADIYSAHGVPHAGWVRNVRRRSPSLYDRAVIYIERRLIKGGASSWFLPVSSLAMETFRQEYSALPGKWQIVHPGVDVARFSLPDRNACREEIRKRYGIGENDLLMLFVGMNFEVKGLDTIIAAIAKAKAMKPDAPIRLLVVGRGDARKYGKIAESLGVGGDVIFAGTQHGGLERFYRAADVFVLFSAFDTFGMVVLEAMAAGLPVIVSPNVGAKDLVEQGVNGFVLPDFRNANAAAGRMIELLDADRRNVMGAVAQAKASEQTWERLAEKMEKLYLEFAAKDENSLLGIFAK